jgi:hypothetical protein
MALLNRTCKIDWVDNFTSINIGDGKKDLFRCENFLDFATVTLSFVYGKYCPIID